MINIFKNVNLNVVRYVFIIVLLLFPIATFTLQRFKEKTSSQKDHDDSIDYVKAHSYSGSNKDYLLKDRTCGCFYCLKIFDPKEITEWCCVAEDDDTAVCPYCGVDSVIGESSGFPITEEFLKKMHSYWF